MSFTFSVIRNAWRIFSAAPHRMFFFTGMWQLVAISVWWAIVLAVRATGAGTVEPVLPSVFTHGGMMLFLMFTPFMAGFLCTVFPRWQPAPEIPRAILLLAFAGFNLAQAGFLAGLYLSPVLIGVALVLLALAWTALLGGLIVSLAQAHQRVPHAWTVLAGLGGGYAGLLLFLYATVSGDWSMWPWTRALGVWAFLLPVYFSVSHRMVPFFSSRVVPDYRIYRPDTLLYTAVALCIARALLEGVVEWRWLASLPLGLVLAWLSWQWWPRARHGHALLSVLHLSLLWLAGGVLLFAVQDALLAAGLADPLGRAPLHALGIGFFGGMLVSMVTRVSLGHAGRPLLLDQFTWLVFWLVQTSVALRILGEAALLARAPGYAWSMALAALMWLAAFAAWAWRFIGVYWRPRADGAPG